MTPTRRLALAALAAAALMPAGTLVPAATTVAAGGVLAPVGSVLEPAARALLRPASLEAQTRPQRPRQRPEQRQALERHFQQRFLEMSRQRLSLQPVQTERLASILERGWRARRDLQRRLEVERERFAAVIGDEDTTDDEFRRILSTMEDLRRQEYELWVSEQRALAEFLTPRQRAMFVHMQMRAIDAVHDMRRRRSAGEDRRERGERDDGGGGEERDRPDGAREP